MTPSARLADAAASLGRAALALPRGALRTARRGVTGLGAAVALAPRHPGQAAPVLLVAFARLLLQLPADALLLLLTRLVSAAQTLLGFEPPGRPLTASELDLLRRVYGDGVDPRRVRIKAGRLGLLGLPDRAFVVGDTLHVPLRAARAPQAVDLARTHPALLVHELAHVWQHQRHGTRYLSECLLAQWLGDGYDVAAGLARGRGFAELNFEQQAELLGQAWAAGWFADAGGGDGGEPPRLMLRGLTDARRDEGRIAVVERDPEAIARRQAAGWADATAALRAGLRAVRADRGRPGG